MENNKIFGALLLAGVIAMLTIIASGMLVQPEQLKANAYPIEGAPEASTGGEAKAAQAEPISGLLATANVDHGAQVAKQCQTCHTFAKGGPNTVGPNNWGVVGAKHAHVSGYAYSEVLEHLPGEWDYESLNKFLYAPQKFLPGTKMGFAGLKKTQDRADLIAWLRTQSDSPAPLPAGK